jgi:phage tail P2-like protein
MSKNLFETSLFDTAPNSIATDPQIRAACKALDAEFLAVSEVIKEVITIGDIDSITDERLLDILAHQLHTDFYQDILTGGPPSIEKKRALIKQSIEWHIYKGTPWVVEQVIRTVKGDAQLVEWYEYNPHPAPRERRYRFRIAIDDLPADPAVYDRLVQAVNSVKNARSWMDDISQMLSSELHVYVGVFGYLEIDFVVRPHT